MHASIRSGAILLDHRPNRQTDAQPPEPSSADGQANRAAGLFQTVVRRHVGWRAGRLAFPPRLRIGQGIQQHRTTRHAPETPLCATSLRRHALLALALAGGRQGGRRGAGAEPRAAIDAMAWDGWRDINASGAIVAVCNLGLWVLCSAVGSVLSLVGLAYAGVADDEALLPPAGAGLGILCCPDACLLRPISQSVIQSVNPPPPTPTSRINRSQT